MGEKYKYSRRQTHAVDVGGVVIGGGGHVVVQSMTTAPTEDTGVVVGQVVRIAEAGGEIVRLTAQGRRQAENLRAIKESLMELGCRVPLVADIHFTSELAMIAARYVEKVRINPGNFVDKRATFGADALSAEYTDAQWEAEISRIRVRLGELIDICGQHHTALRIGVNHGSLSDRIMSRYGNTPLGMVVSAMEFLDICHSLNFEDVVVSMKSSNVVVMVAACRLLADRMQRKGYTYPLHLGVTEAGCGLEGRVRSAVGMGALLSEGLGDTLRMSLTEEPEAEIAPGAILANYFFEDPAWQEPSDACFGELKDGLATVNIEPVVVASQQSDVAGDFSDTQARLWSAVSVDELLSDFQTGFSRVPGGEYVVLESRYRGADWVQSIRWGIVRLRTLYPDVQVVVRRLYEGGDELSLQQFEIMVAADFGGLFVDRLCHGMWVDVQATGSVSNLDVVRDGDVDILRTFVAEVSYAVLQAARARITSADIISCPGCGRTLYDLQGVVGEIKARFGSRRGLKLAVMGCIVNGPGEMADAEYGYVGSGPGLVTLYRGTEVVRRNIPQRDALEALEELINNDKKQ